MNWGVLLTPVPDIHSASTGNLAYMSLQTRTLSEHSLLALRLPLSIFTRSKFSVAEPSGGLRGPFSELQGFSLDSRGCDSYYCFIMWRLHFVIDRKLGVETRIRTFIITELYLADCTSNQMTQTGEV